MSTVGGVLDFVVDRMQIDEAWSLRGERSLTWWASSLAQRIWAPPARQFQDVEFTTLHIETDLLAGVSPDATAWERLAAINRFASLSAYVADPGAQAVRLHASVSLTTDNLPMARALALHAVALQVADAHAEAQALADAFGAQVAASHHPASGPRTTPDEMLGVMGIYQERGQEPSPFAPDELAALVHLDPRPWTVASNAPHRFDAELAFAPGARARIEFDAGPSHPSLGTGLQMRLRLPVEPDAAIAQQLNAAERLAPDAHQLGAWCVDDDLGLLFTGFLPSAAHLPGLSRAMAYHMAARCDWARSLLCPSA